MTDLNNDPELQLDLRTDEISRHLIGRNSDGKHTSENEEKEADDAEPGDEDEQKIEDYENKIDEKESDEEESDDEEEEENKDPKILITTHELKISFITYKLCRELAKILPNAQYFYRKNVRLTKVIPEAIKRDYSAMIVINEDRRVPSKFP